MASNQFPNDHPCFNSLSQSHFVGNEEFPPGGIDQAVGKENLVGQKLSPAIGEFATGVLQGELVGQLLEQEIQGRVKITRFQTIPEVSCRSKSFDKNGLDVASARPVEEHICLVCATYFLHTHNLAHAEVRSAFDTHSLIDFDGRIA
jgi:hypothetical protein